jgi:hypothetical protein
MEPIDAFEWLLREFRRYSHGETTWLSLREVFTQADAILSDYRSHCAPEPHTDHPHHSSRSWPD